MTGETATRVILTILLFVGSNLVWAWLLHETYTRLTVLVDRTTKGWEECGADRAAEAARIDWLEAGGDYRIHDDLWMTFSPDYETTYTAATLREAIDRARAAGEETP